MAKKTKSSRVKTELKRLSQHYDSLSDARRSVADGLIARAAFMRIEMEDLEKDLDENGWTELFSQGKQEPYDRARPQGQLYNALNANYQKVIKQLDAMLPKEEPKTSETDDGFDDFVSGRDAV